MNHLGDNFVDKHRNRPESDIPGVFVYVANAAQRDIPRDSVKVRCDKSGTIIKGSVALHVLESGIVVVVPLIRTVLVCV